jgi:hypothetical protein
MPTIFYPVSEKNVSFGVAKKGQLSTLFNLFLLGPTLILYKSLVGFYYRVRIDHENANNQDRPCYRRT